MTSDCTGVRNFGGRHNISWMADKETQNATSNAQLRGERAWEKCLLCNFVADQMARGRHNLPASY